jgi:hypothetical protein
LYSQALDLGRAKGQKKPKAARFRAAYIRRA